MSRALPVPKAVKDILEDLLGRPVTVSPGMPFKVADIGKKLLVSSYVDDAQQLNALVGMDLPLSAYAGAAIGLIPPAGAQDCITEAKLTTMVAENVTEVCNILAALLNNEGASHVRLHRTFLPGESPPADMIGYLLALGRRLDLNVEVQGYGEGRIAFTLTR